MKRKNCTINKMGSEVRVLCRDPEPIPNGKDVIYGSECRGRTNSGSLHDRDSLLYETCADYAVRLDALGRFLLLDDGGADPDSAAADAEESQCKQSDHRTPGGKPSLAAEFHHQPDRQHVQRPDPEPLGTPDPLSAVLQSVRRVLPDPARVERQHRRVDPQSGLRTGRQPRKNHYRGDRHFRDRLSGVQSVHRVGVLLSVRRCGAHAVPRAVHGAVPGRRDLRRIRVQSAGAAACGYRSM